MTTSQAGGGPGRPLVKIEETDDRDRPYPLAAQASFSVKGLDQFNVIYQEPLIRARRAALMVAVSVATTSAFTGQFVGVEFNVLGYSLAGGDVIYRGALDGFLPMHSIEWEEPFTYNSIGLEARQIIDGLPSGVTTGIGTLALSISGFYWR